MLRMYWNVTPLCSLCANNWHIFACTIHENRQICERNLPQLEKYSWSMDYGYWTAMRAAHCEPTDWKFIMAHRHTHDPVEPHRRNPLFNNPCAPQFDMQPLIRGSPFRLLPIDPNESNHMLNFIRAVVTFPTWIQKRRPTTGRLSQ